jgi:hypothetical protein
MTPESRNSGARTRRPLMSNDLVNTNFQLQRLAKARSCGNEYVDINRSVIQRLSHVFLATNETENNREQSTVLLGDLYSVRMKLV